MAARDGFNPRALLRLLQLTSPALPVGAYAYSQGLEQAVAQGWVTDEASTGDWIIGLLGHPMQHLDVPILSRLYTAWQDNDAAAVAYWNARLYASREAAEIQAEDRHLGMALARLLGDLGLHQAWAWRDAQRNCFATIFSLAAVHWRIPLEETALGYLWTWTENQVAAATRLVPLGQTAGQRLLSQAMPEIIAAVPDGLALEDDDIGCTALGLGMASALHETQYSRLFRS